tara:strand:+ start:1653 stop:3356 length:1704 start_codon:yes stop_codon:yes gene_type:complete
MIIEMSLDNPFFPNPAYYSVGTLVMIFGSIWLVSYILIQNEISISTILNPKKWENYISTLIGFVGLIIFWIYASTMDLSPRTETPFLLIGGTMLTGFILIKNEIKSTSILFIDVIRKPTKEKIKSTLSENWRKYISSVAAIVVFTACILNLSMFSTFIPMMGYDQQTFFTIIFLSIIGSYYFLMSNENDNPSIAAKKSSSVIFLLFTPLIMYLVLRVLLLVKTQDSWEISLDFMDFFAGFSIVNWPNQVDTLTASRWEFHVAGTVNAVRAVLASIFLCTLIGIIIGVMRLSNHPLSSGFATAYVEIFRNMPLALLLFSIGSIIRNALPEKVEQVNIEEVVWISTNGIYIPSPDATRLIIGISILIAFKLFTIYLDRDGFDDSDQGIKRRGMMWASAIAVSAVVVIQAGFDTTILNQRTPEPGSWLYEGGFRISIEFLLLVAGLTIFTSAIVAEIVRGSIQSLPTGQVEAAISLSLTPFQRLRLVILPQALRSMIPSLNNQYMNVWKNSSLALIVSYNDLFYINVVILNKVGKAVPTFFLILVTYQIGSLITSAIMNYFNRRVTKVKI